MSVTIVGVNMGTNNRDRRKKKKVKRAKKSEQRKRANAKKIQRESTAGLKKMISRASAAHASMTKLLEHVVPQKQSVAGSDLLNPTSPANTAMSRLMADANGFAMDNESDPPMKNFLY